MTRKYFYNNRLRHTLPFAAASFTVGLALFACSDKDIDSNENNGKALVAFNVSETQDQAQAAAKAAQPMTRAAFANQLALQDLAPEDLTMQKLPVQGKAGAGLCLIETTLPGVPSQLEATTQTRADITTLPNLGNFSTTAFYGSSDTSLEPWFYDKDTKKDGNLVAPIYWDWIKNHACFYAVYPKPDNSKIKLSPEGYTSTPYVDFEVEPNVKNQKDLMTACSGPVHSTVTNISAMETQATAPRTDLTFRHALTAVRFKVGQNLSYSKHITKVEIVGAKSKGKYTLPTDKNHTGAWDASTLSAPATFTLSGVNVSTSEAVNNIIMGHNQDNYVFYMIPQTLTGVQVKVYFDNAPTPAITANLAGTWKPGTTKTYALSQNTSTWLYELTATPPAPAEYNANATGNYKIESYREDPVSNTKQAVPWEVVGYDTNGDGTFSMTEPLPSWFTGLTTTRGNGSITTTGETGVANLVPEAASNKLAAMNAALKLNAKGNASDYYDLSTHDIKGNTTLRNTANCYVISHPGYYKIPLVYGNAIKNGITNTNSYQTSNSGTYILQHFKDHAGQDITDPWITQSNSGANAPDNAKVVWVDESGLVTNLGLTGSGTNAFVQFEVPAATIKNGNAVIAVTRGGTVVWSWHLWFTHDDALNTVTCTNFQNHEYKFTQENLGMKYTAWSGTSYTSPRSIKVKVRQTKGQISPATRTEAVLTITQNPGSARQGYNTFYQFGRKDAFPGTNTLAEGSLSEMQHGGYSLQNTIQHPDMFYGWNSGYEDVYFKNIWSANNTSADYNDNPVVKTVYDPCPAGFHMPASNAFTGFTKNGQNGSIINVSGAWDNGWNFNNKISSPDATVYFPASGWRGGIASPGGDSGFYWSAVPSRYMAQGCELYFTLWNVYTQYNEGRSAGYSVRPVSE
ncbi:hypothetical protein HMPREF9431_01756 [Segatella oulorum F0390]|uniref:Fimbrillin family protein n=1 Tax=Segatella oulorum F0390 TaxID=702438 RepID=G1WD55_9BACT|nr:fimbrillin family protein [Segatella oulorum]EGV29949.1 hypothetical protein HMPREF9431_01756 [Segatella oulorum F0390]